MKIIYNTLTFISLAIGLGSCSSDEPTPVTPDEPSTPRTVLVYIVAENNLSSQAPRDLQEMREASVAGHFGDSRLLVYYDIKNNEPELIEINSDGSTTTLKSYSNEVMSVTSQRLEEVIADSRAIALARKYGLIFWGHGTGYVQDGLPSTLSYGGEDKGNKSYWMNSTTMAQVLEKKNFDWIYFDCCFMACIETVYELRHATDYILASATELPGEGMPYHLTLRHLMPQDSDLPAAVFETYNYYNTTKSGYDRTCTMSLIKTEGLDNLAATVRQLYASGVTAPDDYIPQAFQTDYCHNRYGWSYYDLAHYINALSPDNAIFNDAFNQVVINAYATPRLWNDISLENHRGLSTLIIESSNDPNIAKYNYDQLAWWRDVVAARWNNNSDAI